MRLLTIVLALSVVASATSGVAQRQMENLTRGAVAIRQPDGRVFVSWRLFGTDPEALGFHVYRCVDDRAEQRVNDRPLVGATCLFDDSAPVGQSSLRYSIRPIVDGDELTGGVEAPVWEEGYLEIPIEPIAGYLPGDASAADLDGDGELEIVLHQTSRGRDNGSAGVTGAPILDAYKLDGTRLWRINLGKNIREGEHYTQFMVYDLDGDGRAEVACKTADGSTDGRGKVIGDGAKDWRFLRAGSQREGRILDGPEYLTIFDGQSGAALKTVDYIPGRDPIDGWGGIGGNAGNDDYGNRCDRFLACVAYLDGRRPSLVMCRGVYGRIVVAAWDWRGGELSSRWVFDTGVSFPPYRGASPFSGMGGHSLSVADVDDDGKDEIVYQAMVVDDDGQGLYSTGLRHGDAMFITDMDPDRPGQEVFSVQENEEHAERFQTPGAAMRDARTGEVLWSHSPAVDVGGGMAADIDPSHRGFEAWGGPGGLRACDGEAIGAAPDITAWTVWWDGDPLRELLAVGRPSWPGGERAGSRGVPARRSASRRFGPSATRVLKWDWEGGASRPLAELEGGSFTRHPNLMGDLLGDWREELLLTAPSGDALRLYSTSIPTDRRLPTLLHDPQYRLGLVWQNVVYNKPCYPSYYLGDGMSPPPPVPIRLVGQGEAIRRGVE